MFSIAMKIKWIRTMKFKVMNETQSRVPSMEVKTIRVMTRNSLSRKLREETNLQIKIQKLGPYQRLSFNTLNLTTKICKMKAKKLRHSSQCKNKPWMTPLIFSVRVSTHQAQWTEQTIITLHNFVERLHPSQLFLTRTGLHSGVKTLRPNQLSPLKKAMLWNTLLAMIFIPFNSNRYRSIIKNQSLAWLPH